MIPTVEPNAVRTRSNNLILTMIHINFPYINRTMLILKILQMLLQDLIVPPVGTHFVSGMCSSTIAIRLRDGFNRINELVQWLWMC